MEEAQRNAIEADSGPYRPPKPEKVLDGHFFSSRRNCLKAQIPRRKEDFFLNSSVDKFCGTV
jgi:hypothetical protein